MKLQKLIIHNIASIEDATINFEAQPLASSEVFLITGKTGAGKSTILDAICLALYADTPRLDSTKMQGDTQDGEKTLKIDDPRQLMRRNTSEAFVILYFIGNNGVHYQSTWSVSRAHKKANGNMQSKSWQLINLDNSNTLTKDKEIEAELRSAIGLDFGQFCRTTMLAQGEFTRFLNSKDDDKAEILEKITGVDTYSKIGAKVFTETAQRKQLWENAMRLAEGTPTLSDSDLGQKKAQLSQLDANQQQLQTMVDVENKKLQWLNALDDMSKRVAEATIALAQAHAVVKSEAFKAKETLSAEWHTTIEARRWMDEFHQAQDSIIQQQASLTQLKNTYSQLLGGQQYIEQFLATKSAELNATKQFLDKEAPLLSIYQQSQTIVGHLVVLQDARVAIEKSTTEINKGNEELSHQLLPASNAANDAVKLAQESYRLDNDEVQKKESEIANLNLPQLRLQRDSAKDQLSAISTAKDRMGILAATVQQHETMRQQLAQRLSSIQLKKEQSIQLDNPIHDAQIKFDVRRDDLAKQSDTIDKFAQSLRAKLKIGDTCPVCRQVIAVQLPHEEELATLVAQLKESSDQAETELRSLIDSKTKLDAEILVESTAYQNELKAFDNDQSLTLAQQRALNACSVCGINVIDQTTLAALESLELKWRDVIDQLEAKIKQGETKEAEAKLLRNQLDTKRKHIETLVQKAKEAENAISEAQKHLAQATILAETKKLDAENAEQHVRELLADSHWAIDWLTQPNAFAQALTLAANTYNAKLQEHNKLSANIDATKSYAESVSSVMKSILDALPEWAESKPAPASRIPNLQPLTNQLLSSVTAALTQLRNAQKQQHESQTLLEEFIQAHNPITLDRLAALKTYSAQDIATVDEELKQNRESVVWYKSLLENAQNQLNDHQQYKPSLAEDDTPQTIQSRRDQHTQSLNQLREQRGAILQELKTDEENRLRLGSLLQDAEQKKADYQRWSRLNQLIGDATGNKFRKIAQSYVLSSLIHSANSYMRTLTDRYTLKVTPGTFVISIEDAYQGYATRAASTISGGESFLVSLSLALALSDIGNTLSVDTLFIDEGFGTLSGEPLQNAVNTLRSLHTKSGRHVGIISHVEELQERIPVQIQVVQEGNNSSSKIIVVPSNEKI